MGALFKKALPGVLGAIITALIFAGFAYLRGTFIVPNGTIAAFETVECPTGWSRYNGANDRFILGAGNNYSVNAEGGQESLVFKYSVNGGQASGLAKYVPPGEDLSNHDKKMTNMPPYIALTFCQKGGG